MSLIEVLISIFVLSIGLLGVAAMIPVGRYEIVEAAKSDRSAVLGRLAMREVKNRGMLDPMPWSLDNPSQVLTMWQGAGNLNQAQYVMIDPLYVTKNGLGNFPAAGAMSMSRINLWNGLYRWGSGAPLNVDAAREIFVSHDDLVFDIPKDRDLRPVRMVSGNRQQYEGNYCWAAMLAPDAAEAAAQSLDAITRSRVTVSIVVFYKRNLDPSQAERVATATSLGGGDMTLTAPQEDLERVKRNHWILLCGRTGGPPAAGATTGPLFHWYRVVAVAAGASATQRDVSLAGPDWTGPATGLQAVLIDGVVGVYTETVETNRDLLREAKPN